jgi:hypothetical protein
MRVLKYLLALSNQYCYKEIEHSHLAIGALGLCQFQQRIKLGILLLHLSVFLRS